MRGLKTGTKEVTWQWCVDHGVEEWMAAAILAEIESVRLYGCISISTGVLTSMQLAEMVTSRMVLAVKLNLANNTVQRFKARWVARGFQDQREDLDTASETLSHVGMMSLVQASVQYGFRLGLLDYHCAFLQGREYEPNEMLRMALPSVLKTGMWGFPSGSHCVVRKSLYGLRDAPRRWQERLISELRALGFRPTKSDPCLLVLPSLNDRRRLNHCSDQHAQLCQCASLISFFCCLSITMIPCAIQYSRKTIPV